MDFSALLEETDDYSGSGEDIDCDSTYSDEESASMVKCKKDSLKKVGRVKTKKKYLYQLDEESKSFFFFFFAVTEKKITT